MVWDKISGSAISRSIVFSQIQLGTFGRIKIKSGINAA